MDPKRLARKLTKPVQSECEQGRREPDYESLKKYPLFSMCRLTSYRQQFFSDLDSFLKQPLNQEPINELKTNLDEL